MSTVLLYWSFAMESFVNASLVIAFICTNSSARTLKTWCISTTRLLANLKDQLVGVIIVYAQ